MTRKPNQRFCRHLLLLMSLSLVSFGAHAQGVDDQRDIDQIDAELGRGAKPMVDAAPPSRSAKETSIEPNKLEDLAKLESFSEISVIQKRYLPKTERFQFFLGLGGIINDPWFYGMGGSARLAYHFSEDWGVEGTYTYLSTTQRQSVQDLQNNNGVQTSSLVTTTGYYGGDIFWSPIYGKLSLLNKRIISFDMYFSGGVGETLLQGADANSAFTIHLGTGQIFALSKAWGFRWDFSVNNFTANGIGGSSQFNNVLLMAGMSYFFPEAKYR